MANKTYKPVGTEVGTAVGTGRDLSLPLPDPSSYLALVPIQHDGVYYQIKDIITLSEKDAALLLAQNAIGPHELLHKAKPD